MQAVKQLVLADNHDTQYCVPLSVRDWQIRVNTKKVAGRVSPEDLKSAPIAIVGFGPSLKKTYSKLKSFKNIITCSGAHKYLLSLGFKPIHFNNWYHLDVDPRAHKLDLLGDPRKGIQYLPASCVHPNYIQKLIDADVSIKLWHVFARDGESEQVLPRGEWSVTGGSDAGMRCMTVARFLGYKNFHIFGMDGSDDPDGRHASEHPNQAPGHGITECNGKSFQTTPALLQCLPRFAVVDTIDGPKTIKEIVDTSYQGKVRSLSADGKFVWNRVTGHSKQSNRSLKKQWVSVVTSPSPTRTRLVCTDDHECAVIENPLSPSVKFVAAKDTVGLYSVRRPLNGGIKDNPLFNKEQLSILIGSLLGDGTINKDGRFTVSHCEKQQDYLDWKFQVLGGKTGMSTGSGFNPDSTSYYLTSPITAQTRLLRELAYCSGHKQVSGLAQYIDDIALAVWYQDDGFLRSDKGRPTSSGFCTDSFDLSDIQALVKHLSRQFGIQASIYQENNRGNVCHRIHLTREGTRRLSKLIAPYVRPVMSYKLLEEDRVYAGSYRFNSQPLEYAVRRVLRVDYKDRSSGYYAGRLYDIEVENDHNFVANGTVVHNCSKQVFHELNQLPDVEYKFYGSGLIQEMAKTYVRETVGQSVNIAICHPELISDDMREQNRLLHEQNAFYGAGGAKYAETVLKMKTDEIQSILDYGAGKQELAKALPFPIWSYDPAIPEICEPPKPADMVVCTDVLEHIEPDKLNIVLMDLQRVTRKIGYFVIHLSAAQKTYPNGQNAHLIQKDANWWAKHIGKFFDIATAKQAGHELHLVVGPKTAKTDPDAIIGVKGEDGIKSRFYTPNDTCRWRAETLLTKEPVTIDWISRMDAGDVLFDIGANVGGYSIWAGVRGVQVYAFEPEAENFALLVRNIRLNNLTNVQAYPLALSNERGINDLFLSQAVAGGSCHTFGAAKDFNLSDRKTTVTQGSFGVPLDELSLPQPDHIKIDVDGLEFQVIKGALKTLKKVRSLLVEINPSIPQHLELVDTLQVLGFTFDTVQVEKARRKDGPFKGVAEYVFYRPTKAEQHIAKAVENAKLVMKPFPHIYVENALPEPVAMPDRFVPIADVRGTQGYPERFVAPDFERPQWMNALSSALCKKFGVTGDFADETLLITDKAGYQIGPHTDIPKRILSAIFYLAEDDKHPELGTSIYLPKDKNFTCEGGKHHSFDQFKRVKTADYKPNAMFAFLRTDNSFHGVEKTTTDRTVLLYDIRRK